MFLAPRTPERVLFLSSFFDMCFSTLAPYESLLMAM